MLDRCQPGQGRIPGICADQRRSLPALLETRCFDRTARRLELAFSELPIDWKVCLPVDVKARSGAQERLGIVEASLRAPLR